MTRAPIPFPGPRAVAADPPLARSSSLWVDAEEAAELLATTAHTMRRLAREGRSPITARRVGSRWRFSRADLNAFIGAAVNDAHADRSAG